MDDILAAITPATADHLDEHPDPIEWDEPTGEIEIDSANEVAAVSDYIARRNAETRRFTNATDTEFWFSVFFPSREHKEAFLQAIGATSLGDKYIGGIDLAEQLGINVEWPT